MRIAFFTTAPWEHALSMLRLVGPAHFCGIELIQADPNLEDLPLADIYLIQRDFPRDWKKTQRIFDIGHESGKPVVFELDDLLLDLPKDHPDRLTHYYTSALVPIMATIVQADAITVSTPMLSEQLKSLNPRLWVLPNYLNEEIWIKDTPNKPDRADSPLIIGYFGGDSHLPDLEYISPVIKNIASYYNDNVSFHFWGCKPPEQIENLPQVNWFPIRTANYAEYAKFVKQQYCDMVVVPLKDNVFNRCKSPLKYFESSILDIPGVYSKIAPFEDVIEHGKDGFLASTPEEWEQYITLLIENTDIRATMAEKARTNVMANWSLSNNANRWLLAFQEILNLPLERKDCISLDDKILAPLAEQIAELEAHYRNNLQISDSVLEMADKIKEQKNQIKFLSEQSSELSEQLAQIHSSKAMRTIRKYWSLRIKLAPHGSLRERLLQWVKNHLLSA